MKVSLDTFTPPEMVEAFQAAFDSVGVDATVAADWDREPEGAYGAGWFIELLLDHPLQGFIAGFAGAAGVDAWKKLKEWAAEVRASGDKAYGKWEREGSIVFRGSDRTEVRIEEIPDEAYEALFKINWDAVKGGALSWDDERREWRLFRSPERRGWRPWRRQKE